MKRISILLFVLTLALAGWGQTFKEYYRSADKTTKEALKIALGTIIKDHTVRSYDQLKTDYKSVYVVDGTTQQVYDLYSGEKYNYSSGGWNREHTVPNSWWGGTKNAAYSDLFSVIPSESSANSRKSNYPPAELSDVDYDTGRILIGSPASGLGGNYSRCWEPYDEFKGDFARIFFYVATCYDNIAWGSKSTSKSEIEKNTWPTLRPWLYKMLMRWHNDDPVSEKEIKINDAVQQIQGNRNPFIDYPVLADYIWGELQTRTFYLDSVVAHAHYSGDIPVPDPDPDPDPDPVDPDTTVVDTAQYLPGELLFEDRFDCVEEGSHSSASGSSMVWTDGDEFFPYVKNVYQAGYAVRLGTGKKVGQIISVPIDYTGRGACVEIDVKGWQTVEVNLSVDLGGDKQSAVYSATMTDDFETLSLSFAGSYDHPTLDISTSQAGRCFIDAVRVYAPEDPTAIEESSIPLRSESSAIYDLTGRRISSAPLAPLGLSAPSGLYILHGKKVFLR